jgi:hypothetical protein
MIVAYFLFSEKPTEKIPFRRRRVLGALLFVFAIFVFLHANIADLADVFTVWATLVLAGVAVFSFEESRRLREENRQREERERKERLLNEILEWAIDVLKLNSDLNSFTEDVRLEFITVSRLTIDKLYSDTMAFRDKGKSIKIISSVAGYKVNYSSSELQNELDKIAGLLNDIRFRIEVGEDPIYVSQLVTTEDAMMVDKDENKDTIARHQKNIAPLCNSIIEEATKIKTKDIS